MFSDHLVNLLLLVGVIGLIVYYKFMSRSSGPSDEFAQFYNEVLNSEKYKVKGKYEQ